MDSRSSWGECSAFAIEWRTCCSDSVMRVISSAGRLHPRHYYVELFSGDEGQYRAEAIRDPSFPRSLSRPGTITGRASNRLIELPYAVNGCREKIPDRNTERMRVIDKISKTTGSGACREAGYTSETSNRKVKSKGCHPIRVALHRRKATAKTKSKGKSCGAEDRGSTFKP